MGVFRATLNAGTSAGFTGLTRAFSGTSTAGVASDIGDGIAAPPVSFIGVNRGVVGIGTVGFDWVGNGSISASFITTFGTTTSGCATFL